jgi:uncharacterized membrane-anchored protein
MRLRYPSHPISLFARLQRVLLVSVLSTIAGVTAIAQVDRAVLEGTVTDPTSAVVGGASVRILAVDTDNTQEQRTNSKGYYRFPGLAVGLQPDG